MLIGCFPLVPKRPKGAATPRRFPANVQQASTRHPGGVLQRWVGSPGAADGKENRPRPPSTQVLVGGAHQIACPRGEKAKPPAGLEKKSARFLGGKRVRGRPLIPEGKIRKEGRRLALRIAIG